MQIGANSELIGAVIVLLLMFGISYNALVAWMERTGYIEGIAGVMVTIGVLFTLFCVWLLDHNAAYICLIAFCLTGIPMLAGSIWRYLDRRSLGQYRYQEPFKKQDDGTP